MSDRAKEVNELIRLGQAKFKARDKVSAYQRQIRLQRKSVMITPDTEGGLEFWAHGNEVVIDAEDIPAVAKYTQAHAKAIPGMNIEGADS